jgi:hypothetical protein
MITPRNPGLSGQKRSPGTAGMSRYCAIAPKCDLDLRSAAVDEQFDPIDETTVIGSREQDCLGRKFCALGFWDGKCDRLFALLAGHFSQ